MATDTVNHKRSQDLEQWARTLLEHASRSMEVAEFEQLSKDMAMMKEAQMATLRAAVYGMATLALESPGGSPSKEDTVDFLWLIANSMETLEAMDHLASMGAWYGERKAAGLSPFSN